MRTRFAELSAEELRDFEMALRDIGQRAAGLMGESQPYLGSKKRQQ